MSEEPEYNKQYHIWREGVYLGIATFEQNDDVDDSFMAKAINGTGELVSMVYIPDSWVLLKENN